MRYSRTFTNSSAITGASYDNKTKTMNIKFVSGEKEYTYYNIPRKEALGLFRSESLGKYFNTHIKKYRII